MAKILQPKRVLLWQEILADIEYPDQGVINELLGGTELVGEVPPFGIFEKTFKMSEATVEELVRSTETSRFRQFDKCRSSGDQEIDELVFKKTLKEVDLGWASGPWSLKDVPEGAVVSRRLCLRQPGKIRLIDVLYCLAVAKTRLCSALSHRNRTPWFCRRLVAQRSESEQK